MTLEYKRHLSLPLRFAPSVRQRANDLAHEEGISLNKFISLAVTERITRVEQSALQVSFKRVPGGKTA
jgi:hypothetical protein